MWKQYKMPDGIVHEFMKGALSIMISPGGKPTNFFLTCTLLNVVNIEFVAPDDIEAKKVACNLVVGYLAGLINIADEAKNSI